MPGPQEALSAACDSWNAGDLEGYLRLYDEEIATTTDHCRRGGSSRQVTAFPGTI